VHFKIAALSVFTSTNTLLLAIPCSTADPLWETSEKFGPYTGNKMYGTRPVQCVGVQTITSNTLTDICAEQYRHQNNIRNCQNLRTSKNLLLYSANGLQYVR
jgi:hypothetical protein